MLDEETTDKIREAAYAALLDIAQDKGIEPEERRCAAGMVLTFTQPDAPEEAEAEEIGEEEEAPYADA